MTRTSNAAARFFCQSLNGRPVARVTSIARIMRRTLFASIASALAGSTARRSRGNGVRAVAFAQRLELGARSGWSGGTRGTRQPSSSAQTYWPVPPATIGSRPRDQMSSSAARAAIEERASVNGSSGASDVDEQ